MGTTTRQDYSWCSRHLSWSSLQPKQWALLCCRRMECRWVAFSSQSQCPRKQQPNWCPLRSDPYLACHRRAVMLKQGVLHQIWSIEYRCRMEAREAYFFSYFFASCTCRSFIFNGSYIILQRSLFDLSCNARELLYFPIILRMSGCGELPPKLWPPLPGEHQENQGN
jgi:hypothetical protein